MITGAISTMDNPFSDMFEDEESEIEYPIDVAFDRVSMHLFSLPSSPVILALLRSCCLDFCFINSKRNCCTH
jgi:hypothetical protein